jgi:hypothetical protein
LDCDQTTGETTGKQFDWTTKLTLVDTTMCEFFLIHPTLKQSLIFSINSIQ